MARLSDLVQRRSFGFGGPEGEMFDEANSLARLSSPMITNQSIAAQRMPQNYIQRTGGQVRDMGPSGRDVRIQGMPAIMSPDNEGLTVYAPSGKQYHTNMTDQRQIEAERQQLQELADLPRRMALAKVQEQEMKAKGGDGGGRTARPMTADQEAKYRQKFGEAYGATINALQSSKNVTDLANELKTHKGLGGITGYAGYAPDFPSGDAAGARQKFETLQGKITKMAKDAAASSGSIGPMAVQEWKILRDQVAAIDPAKLGVKQMQSVLDDLIVQAENAARITEEAYISTFSPDFEMYPQFADPRGAMPKADPSSGRVTYPQGAPQSDTPKVGAIVDGYVYVGGDPANPASWKGQ